MGVCLVGVRTSIGECLFLLFLRFHKSDDSFRQLGLGNRVLLDSVFVPTEITFGRKDAVCLGIYAGGVVSPIFADCYTFLRPLMSGEDLTCFAVEKKNEMQPTTVDLLFCGDGQWGGLGNNTFSNAQGDPVRAKAISGLLECKAVSAFFSYFIN
jgi:hypothetical protein